MILTRSPYYYNVVHPNTYVTSVEFTVEIGTGTISAPTFTQTYTVSKPKPTTATTNTWLDIAPFVRDEFTFAPLSFVSVGSPVVFPSVGEVKIVRVTANYTDTIGSNAAPTKITKAATDGYGYYMDGQNQEPTDKILLTHAEYKADYRGYFIVPLNCASGDADPTVNGVAVDLNFVEGHTNYVKYLKIPIANYSDNFEVKFGGETIEIEPVEECKYDVNEVQFLNRFGVLEVLHFYKTKKESISTQSKTFKNAYTNGVSYDTSKHQMQKIGVKSNKKVRLESGFLNEDYNATITELLQSEKVWIGGKPVNVSSTSLEYKTRAVDKLISYSIEFEYAYDEISNV